MRYFFFVHACFDVRVMDDHPLQPAFAPIVANTPEELDGRLVRLTKLKSRADLNGCYGAVIGFVAERDRYKVKLHVAHGSPPTLLVKRHNLGDAGSRFSIDVTNSRLSNGSADHLQAHPRIVEIISYADDY